MGLNHVYTKKKLIDVYHFYSIVKSNYHENDDISF